MKCSSPDTAHYLGAIRARLDQLYEEHPNDPALREQISDEVDWIDATIERPAGLAQTSGTEPIAFINRRLEDLAEANALYGKDQRLSAPDKIARNDREISWLKDLRSMITSPEPSTLHSDPPETATGLNKKFPYNVEGYEL